MPANLRVVPDTPPRAVLYLRQSTYREESISLELQETAGRDYCARMGYVVTAVEADPGISGRTWKRPAVQRVMTMIEEGDADIVVLWRWSRLSRSRKDWAVAADRVDVAGGRIESATEPNDVTAAGRFARGVMTELAAFESERIGEQWMEVQGRRRSIGLPGGGKVPYGWKYVDGRVVPHPDQAPAITSMYEMYLAGAGARQIGAWLKENGYLTYSGKTDWNHSSVTQTLDSPFHAGFVVHKGELLPGAHDALIDAKTWQRYRAIRGERADTRAVKHRYLLSGITRCATCDEPMYGFYIGGSHGHRTSNDYFGYRCKMVALRKGPHGPGTMSARVVDAKFMGWLESVAAEVDTFTPEPIEPFAKLDAERISREITAIDKQVISLTEGLASGLVPERAYSATVTALETKRATLTDSLRTVESRIILMPENPRAMAQALLNDWDELQLEGRRQLIRDLVTAVVVDCREPRTITVIPRWGKPVAIAL